MSDHWTSLEDLDSTNEQHQSVRKLIDSINAWELCERSLEFRRNLEPQLVTSVTCSLNLDKFTYGRYNVVLQLLFSDGPRWIARIRIPSPTEDHLDVENSIMSEIATISIIKARTTIPVPDVFGFDVSPPAENKVRARYMLMAELPGRVLDKIFARSVPDKIRGKVALQFAGYFYQLSTLRFHTIGALESSSKQEGETTHTPGSCDPRIGPSKTSLGVRGNITTSLEYFYLERRECNQQALAQNSTDKDIAASAWFLEQAISSMVLPDRLHGPFPLCHTDMHYNNILLDQDYNITGVVDWSDLSTGPIELFAANPEFMTYPGLSEEQNQPIREFARVVAMEVERLAKEHRDEIGIALAGLIGSAKAELVYRCICTWPWRTKVDSWQALRLLYGKDAVWNDFKVLYQSSQIRSERDAETNSIQKQ